MKIKHIAQAALAVVASVAVNAASAAAPTGNATAAISQAALSANNIVLTAFGAATYSSGILSLTAAQSSTSTTLIDFANGDGFKLAGSATISLLDLSYNVSTNTLNGMVKLGNPTIGLTLFNTGPIANATSFMAVADPDGANDLLVSGLTLTPEFVTAISAYIEDPTAIPLGSILTSMSFENYGFAAPVPEPTTYALMGLGLVGISLVARRRQA